MKAKGTEKVRDKLIQWNTENHILTENAFEYVWKEALNQIGFINPKFVVQKFPFFCRWKKTLPHNLNPEVNITKIPKSLNFLSPSNKKSY